MGIAFLTFICFLFIMLLYLCITLAVQPNTRKSYLNIETMRNVVKKYAQPFKMFTFLYECCYLTLVWDFYIGRISAYRKLSLIVINEKITLSPRTGVYNAIYLSFSRTIL